MASSSCPRCDGNGTVDLYEVAGTNQRFFVCDECEAAWPPTKPLLVELIVDLSRCGVDHDWSLLQLIED